MGALKVEVLVVYSKPFTLQTETGNWRGWSHSEFLALCQGWGFWQECVPAFPTCFDVGICSLAQCVGVTQPVSGFLSEGVASCITTSFVCPWEVGTW